MRNWSIIMARPVKVTHILSFFFFIYKWSTEKEIWLRVHVGHVKGISSLKGQWIESQPRTDQEDEEECYGKPKHLNKTL